MWDDDYDDYHERPVRGNYEVQKVYMIGRPPPRYDLRPPGESKFSFSQTELWHLSVSMVVLIIAFSILFSGLNPSYLIAFLPISAIAVVPGFLFHEMAHKYVAQKYGCWAEYRYEPRGLVIALITAVIGFLWAALGAVYISGHVSRVQNGKISVAGPGTNIVIALITLPLYIIFVIPNFGTLYSNFYSNIYILMVFFSFWLNIILAGFNMIPILPWDGAKVLKWNVGIFILVWVVIIGIGAGTWYIGL